MKRKMEPPEMEFIEFDTADIIVTSGGPGEEPIVTSAFYNKGTEMGSLPASEVHTTQ